MDLADAVWQEEGQGMIGYKNAGMALIFIPYITYSLVKRTEVGLVPPSQIVEKI